MPHYRFQLCSLMIVFSLILFFMLIFFYEFIELLIYSVHNMYNNKFQFFIVWCGEYKLWMKIVWIRNDNYSNDCICVSQRVMLYMHIVCRLEWTSWSNYKVYYRHSLCRRITLRALKITTIAMITMILKVKRKMCSPRGIKFK